MSGQKNRTKDKSQELVVLNPAVEEKSGNLPIADHHENTRLEFGDEIRKMIHSAGTLKITKAENETLFAPFKDEEVYIKPDGLIYLSWFNFSNRLNSVFGLGGWTMVAEGMPKVFDKLVVWGFHLIIRGIYCGTAIGEQRYFDNGRMTYGEACEGAKSNALMRLCKGLGIGLQLWDEVFINRWLDDYATFTWEPDYRNPGKNKKVWTLKAGAFGKKEEKPSKTHKAEGPPVSPNSNRQTVNTNTAESTRGMSENKEFLKEGSQNTGKGGKKGDKVTPLSNTLSTKSPELKAEEKTESLKQQLLACTTGIDLKSTYNTVKIAWQAAEINTEQKESLRLVANKLGTKLINQK